MVFFLLLLDFTHFFDMKYSLFILLSIFIFSLFSCTQVKNNSIPSKLFSSERYLSMDSVKKQSYLDSLHSYLKIQPNDSLHRSFLFDLSSEYYYLKDYKKSKTINQEIIYYSTKANDVFSLGRANYYIGDCYENFQKDSAYYYYDKAEKIFRTIGNKEKIGNMLFKKAYLLFFEGNYIESEVQDSKALEFLKKTKNYQLLFSSYTVIGFNFDKLEEYDNALKYYQLANNILIVLKKNDADFDKKNDYSVSSALNLSNVYVKLGQYKKAIQELNGVNTKFLKLNYSNDYASIIGNRGYTKMKSGDLKGCISLFRESLQLAKKGNFQNIMLYQYLNFGEYYLVTKNNIESTRYLKESLRLAQKIKATDEIKIALRFLAQADPKNGVYYDERYIAVNDSLNKLQRKSRDKFARIEYETSVVEDANKVLTKKNLYLLVGSLFFILVLAGALIYRYIKSQKNEIAYRKQQQNAEEEIFELLKDYQIKLSEAKEKEQNRISKELHDSVMNKLYGVRLQLGILNDSNVKEVKEKRLDYVDALQEIEQEIRIISHDLHTDVIAAHFDYVSLLSSLTLQHDGIGGTRFTFSSDATIDWDAESSLVKITIYRIVQEALSNVIKYAGANQCEVKISLKKNGGLRLVIADDGKGFDAKNSTNKGIGLKNMKERAKTIDATFSFTSVVGKGTSITVIFGSNV